jgi:ABC-type multidrug transport system fused ATPase/permease subunit
MNSNQKIFGKVALIFFATVFYISVGGAWQGAWKIYLQIPTGWPEIQLIEDCSIKTLLVFFNNLLSPASNLFIFIFACAYFYRQFMLQKQSVSKVGIVFHIFVVLSIALSVGFYAYHSSIGKLYVVVFACEYIFSDLKTRKRQLSKLQLIYRLSARLAAIIVIGFSVFYFAYMPLKFHFVITRVESAQTATEEKLAFQVAKECGTIDRIWFAGDETRFRFYRDISKIPDKKEIDMRLTITWRDSSPFTHKQYQAHRVLIDIKNLDYIGYRPPEVFQ